jgi:hypothetical protein
MNGPTWSYFVGGPIILAVSVMFHVTREEQPRPRYTIMPKKAYEFLMFWFVPAIIFLAGIALIITGITKLW